MTHPESFSSIIDLWPSLDAFAADLGVVYVTAQSWRQRNNIRSEYWDDLIAAAKRRGIRITEKDLVRVAAKRRKPTKPRSRARPNQRASARPAA